MDSFIATKKDKKIVVSLDNKIIFERYRNNIQAIAKFTARKEELKRFGYHIQHVAVDTIEGMRIEKSEPIRRQRKVRTTKILGRRVIC